jgi:hypothetical protein
MTTRARAMTIHDIAPFINDHGSGGGKSEPAWLLILPHGPAGFSLVARALEAALDGTEMPPTERTPGLVGTPCPR